MFVNFDLTTRVRRAFETSLTTRAAISLRKMANPMIEKLHLHDMDLLRVETSYNSRLLIEVIFSERSYLVKRCRCLK